ncbi:MAG: glycoside hydrolase family 31 protein [Deltaproteobacteria bacterium]|nr:glycoside hydrolase family 31 protein [Deltaproteobacteria bacterium]
MASPPQARYRGTMGRRASRTTAVATASLLLGCGSEPVPGPPGGEQAVLGAGDFAVRVQTLPLELALVRGDTVLLRLGADGLQLGLVAAVDDGANYDPYRVLVPDPIYTLPDPVLWHSPVAARLAGADETELALALDYGAGLQAELSVAVERPGSFRLVLRPSPATAARTAFVRLNAQVDAQEGFYGLGEYFDQVDQRGKVRAMQIELQGELESKYNEAHVPVPFVLGTTGWGLFAASPYPGAFAVASEQPDRVTAAFGTGMASGEGLGFHLFGAGHPLDVTRLYYEVTGYPRLPARWALGPWIWRDENEDQAQVESDIETIRELDLATTGYWIDRPYATAVNTFDFDPQRFPDPKAMIAHLHALGLRTALWHTPYLDEEAAATAKLRAEAEQKGYYPPQVGVALNNWGRPVDLTNPDAVEWWRGLLGAYADLGVEGFKLDYGEDVVLGLNASRLAWLFHDGSDERTMHAFFQRFYHDAYAELLPEQGGFLLCRAGTYGDQEHGPIIWPGDLDSSFARHGEDVSEKGESYVAVGGLPASVVAGLSLGPSGFPFFGADTGGYRHSPPDKELFVRWFEQTALSTVMQIGTSTNNVAWEFGPETGFDEEMLGWYRRYTRLHLRLFPYLWTYAERLREDGRPIARALGLAHPELGLHPSDVYLLGDELLVAPVLERGARARTVPFPEGRWIHWWTGQSYDGGAEQEIDAPLDSLPLFLRAGGLVPMLRPTIDTLAPTTEPERVDSYASAPGVLYVRAVSGAAGSFELFDGGRVAQAVEDGAASVSVQAGGELSAGAVFELMAAARPAAVLLSGKPLDEHDDVPALEQADAGWCYEKERGGVLWVKLPAGAEEARIEWK